MKTLIRVAKGLGALIAGGILFLIIVINFGTIESRLECSGQVQRQGERGSEGSTPATLYAQVETYRWFVFWTDHDAMIKWEIQPGDDIGFGYYDQSGFKSAITDFSGTKHLGSISSLSNQIFVLTSSSGSDTFEGACR